MSIHVVEWTERQSPALGAVLRVGDQAEVAEEDIHALAIGHRTGRGRRISRLVALQARTWNLPPPDDLARGPPDGERIQLAALVDHLLAPGVGASAAFSAGKEDQ